MRILQILQGSARTTGCSSVIDILFTFHAARVFTMRSSGRKPRRTKSATMIPEIDTDICNNAVSTAFGNRLFFRRFFVSLASAAENAG
jgi:hypothetical protein